MKKNLCIILSVLSVAGSVNAHADGLLIADVALRNDLAWLSNKGVINLDLTTWPLSQSEINRALDAAQPRSAGQRQVIEHVESRIRRIRSDVRVKAYLSTGKDALPQSFAMTQTSQNGESISISQDGDWWDIHLNANAEYKQYIDDQSVFNLNNSYAAVKFANQWLAFGQIPQSWGPGNEGSLIRSDAARPLTGFLMQRAEQTAPETTWLNWVGPWQYQLMGSQIDQYEAVPHTKVVGGRFTFSPGSGPLSIGMSHVMQWGGEGRPSDFSSFWDAATGKEYYGTDNPLGNHLAGFDVNYKLGRDFGVPVNVYGQMIGENVKHGFVPSQYMYLAGIEGHHQVEVNALNWYVEYHDTRSNGHKKNLSYQHQVYKDGYYQQGYPLGDAIGGDGQLFAAKMELVTPENQRWSARVVYAKVNPENQYQNTHFAQSDNLTGLQLGWEGDIYKEVRLGGMLWYVDADKNDTGAGMNIEVPFNF